MNKTEKRDTIIAAIVAVIICIFGAWIFHQTPKTIREPVGTRIENGIIILTERDANGAQYEFAVGVVEADDTAPGGTKYAYYAEPVPYNK